MIKILLILFLSISVWANIGNVMAVKGEAQIKRADKLLGVSGGMELMVSDEVLTKTKSRVQVMLSDDTIVTIGANSSFVFDEFSFGADQESKVAMRANRGFFRSVTGKIGKMAPERFKVKTASATIGIRGTDFSGEIEEAREIVKCYSGTIFVDFEGVSRDIEAGMMIEISELKVEVKEIAVAKPKESSSEEKKVAKKQVADTAKKATVESVKAVVPTAIEVVETTLELEVEDVEAAVEDVADVTLDIISESIDESIADQETVVDEEPVVEPFDIVPGTQDREIQY